MACQPTRACSPTPAPFVAFVVHCPLLAVCFNHVASSQIRIVFESSVCFSQAENKLPPRAVVRCATKVETNKKRASEVTRNHSSSTPSSPQAPPSAAMQYTGPPIVPLFRHKFSAVPSKHFSLDYLIRTRKRWSRVRVPARSASAAKLTEAPTLRTPTQSPAAGRYNGASSTSCQLL